VSETFIGARNLATPHLPEDYPGLLVVRPDPRWAISVIVLREGETLLARGGEAAYAYETADGAQAQGFELREGDRAVLARSGLPHSFAEWKVERRATG
jgi:hypothetical protein